MSESGLKKRTLQRVAAILNKDEIAILMPV